MRNHDPFEYIRNYYRVPAYRGSRVEVEHNGKLKQGTITGAHNQYIKITFDGEKKPAGVFHPTDGIKYITRSPTPAADLADMRDAGVLEPRR